LDLVIPTRQLIKEGDIDILKGKSTQTRRVYLFSDLILICASKGKKSDKCILKHKFFLKDVAVIDVADVEVQRYTFTQSHHQTITDLMILILSSSLFDFSFNSICNEKISCMVGFKCCQRI
jgi:hypothetical protein